MTSESAELLQSVGPELSAARFVKFSNFITETLGIKMPASKQTMLKCRLQKRLRQLKLDSFDKYYNYVFSSEGREKELSHLLDVVTTNKTDFFREPRHYEVLEKTALPDIMQRTGAGIQQPLNVWSAGCSIGAEPYTLAMVLSEFGQHLHGFSFQIVATDISTQVLKSASLAVYEQRDALPIPPIYKKKYLLRSKDRSHPRVRIVPELRRLVEFRRLNLMDADYGVTEVMDIIFCRNVIIYFDRQTQLRVLGRLCNCLKVGGYLFMGHSETLNGFRLPLHQKSVTVYQKHGSKD